MKTVYYNGYNWYNCNDGLLFLLSFISIEIIASWTNLEVQDDWLLYVLRDEMSSKWKAFFSLLKMYEWDIYDKSWYS